MEGVAICPPRHQVFSIATLQGRNVLLHEENTAVFGTSTKLTTRSPVMMTELRSLWYHLDTIDIRICARYIRSSANIWADSLSRELIRDDWHFNSRDFVYLLHRT
jgi:hypothetical protein